MPAREVPPLPEEALEEKFLAATGPGGQNVNKVATAVQLRLDAYALRLSPPVFARLKRLAGSRWTQDGGIVITARTHRTREANRAEARTRLAEMVAEAHIAPVKRVKTRPSKAAKVRRVETKSQRGVVKRGRARPSLE
jgi:ribosome-associated protein